MEKDVRKYIKQCHKCQVNEAKNNHKEEFVLTDTAAKPWDITYIDTVGPFRQSGNGNR